MIDLPDGWRDWRTNVDRRLERHGDDLDEHSKAIVRLETRQQIISDNAEARSTKTPSLAFGLFSAAVTLIVLVMQILAWRGGSP